MTKNEVVKKVAQKTSLSEHDVELVINKFIDVTKRAVGTGETVYLRKFGSFEPKKRASKRARDISRGKEIVIPACYIPSFKPSAEFKNEVKTKLQNK